MEKCFYMGEAYDEDDQSTGGYVADVIANLVELHINSKYSEWKIENNRPCTPHPAPFATDFFDALDDSCGQLSNFLASKHASIHRC